MNMQAPAGPELPSFGMGQLLFAVLVVILALLGRSMVPSGVCFDIMPRSRDMLSTHW